MCVHELTRDGQQRARHIHLKCRLQPNVASLGSDFLPTAKTVHLRWVNSLGQTFPTTVFTRSLIFPFSRHFRFPWTLHMRSHLHLTPKNTGFRRKKKRVAKAKEERHQCDWCHDLARSEVRAQGAKSGRSIRSGVLQGRRVYGTVLCETQTD